MSSTDRALLDIDRFSLQIGQSRVVDDVSLQIKRGERVALVGESGSGKTVTALSVMRLLDVHDMHYQGDIRFDGTSVFSLNDEALRRLRGDRVAMVFQEPMTALNPLKTVGAQIAEVVELHRAIKGRALRDRVYELLEKVHLPDPARALKAFPHELSGGQRQRAMIAMAIACDPELLIADEPTTALDAALRSTIMSLLVELQAQMDMSLLLITHDLPVVQRYTDRVLVMRSGRVVEQGSVQEIFEHPKDDYTRTLLAARNTKPLIKPVSDNTPCLLEARNLDVIFGRPGRFWRRDTQTHIVKALSLTLKQGETLGVVGESGSGKTTLALALLNLIDGVAGEIRINNQRVDGLREKQFRPFRRDLQVVFQDPFGALSPRMNIADIVGEGLTVHAPDLPADQRDDQIAQVLAEVGLDTDILHRYPHEFSGGQRQRIAIARALILRPKVLILDEPTSALDASVQLQVLNLLASLQKRHNLSLILITHDLAVVRALAHRVLVLYQGEVVEHSTTESLLSNPQHHYSKMLIESAQLSGVS